MVTTADRMNLSRSITHRHKRRIFQRREIATRSRSPRALQVANQISQRSTSHRRSITEDSFQRRRPIVAVAICCRHDVARPALISASSIDLVRRRCFQSWRVTFR